MAKTRAPSLTYPPASSITEICQDVIECLSCPRLRQYCTEVASVKRKSYLADTYWGKPIPGFGVSEANLVIIGLAPAAHGANRTGRVFTGDRSGDWLYRALFKTGFANQPRSHDTEDGLKLDNCYITCAVKCAPPDNKPTPEELKHCSFHLKRELQSLNQAKVYLALGQIAFHALWPLLSPDTRRPDFKHGSKILLPRDVSRDQSDVHSNEQWLILSYHPSQQNTFTGRLTESMFDQVFNEAKLLIAK